MAKILAFANQKGGVGKTTTCVNLCAALTQKGLRVLLVDCDPQGNATSGMGVKKNRSPNIYDMLIHDVPSERCVVTTSFGDVIPSGRDFAAATVELISRPGRERILYTALQRLYTEYDYIFLDCPPSLELITVNALAAADSVLIPMQCEYYALEGITDLIASIRLCSSRLNKRLKIEGILLTMYDGRANLTLPSCGATCRTRSTRPSFPVRSASRRRPVTGFPGWSMTRTTKAAAPIWPWRMNF